MNASIGLEFISFCPCCRSTNIEFSEAILSPFFAARALSLEPVKIEVGEFRDLESGTSYQPCKTIYCNECLSVSCSARLSESSMNKYYSGYQNQDFINMRSKYEPSFTARMKARTSPNTFRVKGEKCSYIGKVEEYYLNATGQSRPLKILDYGGGSGANTPFQSCSDVTVLDIDASNIIDVDAETQKRYDLVCLMNVLEHVNNPEEVLRAAMDHCRSDVDVLIELPLERFMHNLENTTALKSKKIWTEHINCFSPVGMVKLANAAGLMPYTDAALVMETSQLFGNSAEENCKTMLLACRYNTN